MWVGVGMSMTRTYIHGESHDHTYCPDVNCCPCECRACKRAWFAAGRPSPKDCPEHGPKQTDLTRFDRLDRE